MAHLFHCDTISQYRIMRWLEEQGITADDIGNVQFPDGATVRITNAAGAWMVVKEADGLIEIDQTPE